MRWPTESDDDDDWMGIDCECLSDDETGNCICTADCPHCYNNSSSSDDTSEDSDTSMEYESEEEEARMEITKRQKSLKGNSADKNHHHHRRHARLGKRKHASGVVVVKDEGMLLLKRYNECLGLEDKPECNNFPEDSNNNRKPMNEKSPANIKQEILDTPVSGGVHSQTDDDSMDESEIPSTDVKNAIIINDNNNSHTNIKHSPKTSEPTIVRPIPTNPFQIPNQQQIRSNFLPSLSSDHTGLLTFLDEEGKRRAAMNVAQANFNNVLQNFANGKDLSTPLNAGQDTSGRDQQRFQRPVYPNSEFRRTSAPACLWSTVSMLNNSSTASSNMVNINEAIMNNTTSAVPNLSATQLQLFQKLFGRQSDMLGACGTKSPSTSSSPDSGLGHESQESSHHHNETINSSINIPTTSTTNNNNNNEVAAAIAAATVAAAAATVSSTTMNPSTSLSFPNSSTLPWPWLNTSTASSSSSTSTGFPRLIFIK
uniref:Uncharacterized protein n=1 Tax=Panagrolaimus superbus TaxID=310955 RepID=A0A914YRY0_9BILA